MRGEHVVIGGNDADIVTQHAFQRRFVIRLAGGEAVRQITAGEACTMDRLALRLLNAGKISFSRGTRAFGNTFCYP